jgi:hypothetical protein
LLHVESDDTDRRCPGRIGVEPADDLVDHRTRLKRVGAQQLSRAAAVELAVDANQVDAVPVHARIGQPGPRCRE